MQYSKIIFIGYTVSNRLCCGLSCINVVLIIYSLISNLSNVFTYWQHCLLKWIHICIYLSFYSNRKWKFHKKNCPRLVNIIMSVCLGANKVSQWHFIWRCETSCIISMCRAGQYISIDIIGAVPCYLLVVL